jgi:hypothetical protein
LTNKRLTSTSNQVQLYGKDPLLLSGMKKMFGFAVTGNFKKENYKLLNITCKQAPSDATSSGLPQLSIVFGTFNETNIRLALLSLFSSQGLTDYILQISVYQTKKTNFTGYRYYYCDDE